MSLRTVLLYGRSLLLSGVAASLEQCPALRVTRVATWAQARRLIAGGLPDVLILDMANARDSHVLSLLLTNPALLMIGLDPDRNRAVLVSGREAQSLTVNQILEIVQRGDAALQARSSSAAQPSADSESLIKDPPEETIP